MTEINESVARKCLSVIDAGLIRGLGTPQPGRMCVEAAINFALDRPHGDDPGCVSMSLRRLKIRLNDSKWSSNKARARGLRRLALAQLGSLGVLDEAEFVRRLVIYSTQTYADAAAYDAAADADAAAADATTRPSRWYVHGLFA